MKSKGFTLIELLAVIVVLAIIALIATPIVINMIGNSKESADDRSAELYLDAVEQAVVRKNLTEKFSPSTCTIQSDGNLKCDDDVLLEIEIDNTKPTSGTITFDEGNILTYEFYINAKKYSNFTPDYCFETENIDGGVSITEYKCDGRSEISEIISDVIIPNTINNKRVIKIGDSSFEQFYIESVIIPNSVTNIGNFAFGNNLLTSIIIPNSVESIGISAFDTNYLTSIEIPSSVTSIGDKAFYANRLTSVKILGKSSLSDFISFGSSVFDWADGYSDSNIIFES